jgi:hypothetical protein
VQAVVVGSDLRRTGWFTCSDPGLERLHENVEPGGFVLTAGPPASVLSLEAAS